MVNQYCAFFCQKLTTALLESAEGRKRLQKIFHDQSPWKDVAIPAGVKPATSWSPVGRPSNWATKAGRPPWISRRGRMTVEMINLHDSYVAELRFKLVTCGSAIRHATNYMYTMESCLEWATENLIPPHIHCQLLLYCFKQIQQTSKDSINS